MAVSGTVMTVISLNGQNQGNLSGEKKLEIQKGGTQTICVAIEKWAGVLPLSGNVLSETKIQLISVINWKYCQNGFMEIVNLWIWLILVIGVNFIGHVSTDKNIILQKKQI